MSSPTKKSPREVENRRHCLEGDSDPRAGFPGRPVLRHGDERPAGPATRLQVAFLRPQRGSRAATTPFSFGVKRPLHATGLPRRPANPPRTECTRGNCAFTMKQRVVGEGKRRTPSGRCCGGRGGHALGQEAAERYRSEFVLAVAVPSRRALVMGGSSPRRGSAFPASNVARQKTCSPTGWRPSRTPTKRHDAGDGAPRSRARIP